MQGEYLLHTHRSAAPFSPPLKAHSATDPDAALNALCGVPDRTPVTPQTVFQRGSLNTDPADPSHAASTAKWDTRGPKSATRPSQHAHKPSIASSRASESSTPSSTPNISHQTFSFARGSSTTPSTNVMSPPPSRVSGQSTIRLNWAEMICYTISESPGGRLVIQDLFEGMCHKFPDIREWAAGKDWEARVKNRIKSTLSIKGNLFVKVPRPSNASGKGSWWTLSAEAQGAYRQGRVAEAVRGQNTSSNAGGLGSAGSHGKHYGQSHRMSPVAIGPNSGREPPMQVTHNGQMGYPQPTTPSLERATTLPGSFDYEQASPVMADNLSPSSYPGGHSMQSLDAVVSPVLSNTTTGYAPMNSAVSDGSMSQTTIGSPGTPASLYANSPAMAGMQPSSYPMSYGQGMGPLSTAQNMSFTSKPQAAMGHTINQPIPFLNHGQDMQLPFNLLNDHSAQPFGSDVSRSVDDSAFANMLGRSLQDQRPLYPNSNAMRGVDIQDRRSMSAFSSPNGFVDHMNPGMDSGIPALSLQALANLDARTLSSTLSSFSNESMFDLNKSQPNSATSLNFPGMQGQGLMYGNTEDNMSMLPQLSDSQANFAAQGRQGFSGHVDNTHSMITNAQANGPPHSTDQSTSSFNSFNAVNANQLMGYAQSFPMDQFDVSSVAFLNTPGQKLGEEDTHSTHNTPNRHGQPSYYADGGSTSGAEASQVVSAR